MANKIFGAIDYQNVPGGLVRIDGSLLSQNDVGFVVATNDVYYYKLHDNDTSAETNLSILKPVKNGENKRWKLVSFSTLIAASQAATNAALNASASEANCLNYSNNCNIKYGLTTTMTASAAHYAEVATTQQGLIGDRLASCTSYANAAHDEQLTATAAKDIAVTKAGEAAASALAAAAIVNPGSYTRSMGGYAYKNILGIVCPPSLELVAADYLAADNGAPTAFTFTRASTATGYDQVGNVITYQNNELRHDFDPVTGAYKGWFQEGLATNLLLQSEDFLTTWSFGGTKTANTTLSPDGVNTTGDTIALTTTNPSIYQTTATAAANGTAATFSVWMKLISGGPQVVLDISRTGSLDVESSSNLTLTTSWQRFIFSHSATWTGTTTLVAQIRRVGVDCTFAVWGAQLEATGFSTSYIKTTTGTAQRQPDALNIATSALPFNNNEGTIYVEFLAKDAAINTHLVTIDDNTTNNKIFPSFNSSSGLTFSLVNSGSQQLSMVSATTTLNVFHRAAFGYALNNTNMAINGVASTTDTTCNVNTTYQYLRIGSYSGSSQTTSWIKQVIYFPRRLTNAELQLLTGN